EDLLVDAEGRPQRIDGAFSWEAPIAAHGMMHLVITNAWKGDPYPIDTLFMYMANMAWNSAMNTAGTIAMLTDRDPATGGYRIPRIIYADAYCSEMVAYADLVFADTTYLERWDCISLLDRPISEADGPADSIRQPVVAPDRDVRPFQDVLLELGARLGLPGMTDADGSPTFPGGYPDYLINHERKAGVGSLAGWRGKDGSKKGQGEPNPDQLRRYVENGCFWHDRLPPGQRYFRFANRDYLAYARDMGFIDAAEPVVMQLYSEPLQKFRQAARGHGPVQPPDHLRHRVETYFDPLPIWYPPFEDAHDGDGTFPLHAITQRPMAMYHSWHGQNAWLRQIHAANRLYVPAALARELGIGDGDWVWLTSRHARIKAQVRPMEGVNRHTVWTWNAIGKRAGAWNLAPDAPEAARGFLLNHLIDELLPEREGGYRYANADPVTGQAAWYDLRVRIEKARPEEAGLTEPRFAPLCQPPGVRPPPRVLRYGARRDGRFLGPATGPSSSGND
ncbi:MAG TPA: molybdopterin oxidoreductase family protein, partial [Geminicoccaceae bacterium]|nr:molybdopterin oxidoreductase family protein [Geminicoccaceae bacterium]